MSNHSFTIPEKFSYENRVSTMLPHCYFYHNVTITTVTVRTVTCYHTVLKLSYYTLCLKFSLNFAPKFSSSSPPTFPKMLPLKAHAVMYSISYQRQVKSPCTLNFLGTKLICRERFFITCIEIIIKILEIVFPVGTCDGK